MSTIELTDRDAEPTADVGPDFATVYSENLNKVWRFVRARVPDHAEAHDVTSEVFVRAWRAWDRFDPGRGPVEPWLFTIAARAVVDWHRRKRPEPVDASTVVDLAGATEDRPEAAVLQQELLVQLAAAMEQLSDREREGLALRFAARLSSSNVARVLGTSQDAAKQMLHRAIGKLRGRIGVDDQAMRTGAVADLEAVIDDVLARGHVAMRDSELHGLLVHLAAVHDAPVPNDLSHRVADCVACEATAGVATRDAVGRRKGRIAALVGSVGALFAWVPVCLACVVPAASSLMAAAGLGAISVTVHEVALIIGPVIAWMVWRAARRHGQILPVRIAIAGAAAMILHGSIHATSYLLGEKVFDAVPGLFAAADVIGTALLVLAAAANLVHTRRWRDVEMREFQRITAIAEI